MAASGAKRPFQTSAASDAGVLRDRNDLKVLTGCADFIPNSLAHQKPCHWGYEGNRTGLRVRFVLPHDTIFLHASIVGPEGHRAPKGNGVSRRRISDDLGRPNSRRKVLSASLIHDLLRFRTLGRRLEVKPTAHSHSWPITNRLLSWGYGCKLTDGRIPFVELSYQLDQLL